MPNKMKAYFKRDENAFQTLHYEFVNGFARQSRRFSKTTFERRHEPQQMLAVRMRRQDTDKIMPTLPVSHLQ